MRGRVVNRCLALVLPVVALGLAGCSRADNGATALEQYKKQLVDAEKVFTFDLQSVTLGEFPVSQTVNEYTLVIDGLIAKARESEDGGPDNVYVFGLGKPGFTATIRLVDKSGDPVAFSVESFGVSNNNQFKAGPSEPPRCPVFATGLRGKREVFKDYPIGPSYGLAGQFNTFRFRQNGRMEALVLKAEPTGKEYYPCFDDFVVKVGYVASR